MTTRIKAYQIAPESQDSSFYLGEPQEDIMVLDRTYGRGRGYEYKFGLPRYEVVFNVATSCDFDDLIENCTDALCNMTDADRDTPNVIDRFSNEFEGFFRYEFFGDRRIEPKDVKGIFVKYWREAIEWHGALDSDGARSYKACHAYDDAEKLIDLLTVIFGGDWQEIEIRGCCQGDWATCIYNASVLNDDDIDRFESLYFNTGSEFIVQVDGGFDNGGEEYAHYTTKWDNDEIKEEIADSCRLTADDVKLYLFDGYTYTPKYTVA